MNGPRTRAATIIRNVLQRSWQHPFHASPESLAYDAADLVLLEQSKGKPEVALAICRARCGAMGRPPCAPEVIRFCPQVPRCEALATAAITTMTGLKP